ncbi:sugar ABC transporter substrate-binding protein [Butyrivibrio sp. XPD2002]|uniref:sugar ABC transporter substrate-binding protein n=1 Tax=Butyrivibrio sp. XPD2002 TaxID=1280665 RepID=UPI0004162736|nr:substrate-binding domain-containing protein [Butyrivibrio sp. XPD2002]
MAKNRSRIILAVIAALILSIVISTYALVKSSAENEDYTISVVVEDSQSERWNSFRLGAESAATDRGVMIDFVNTSGFSGAEEELSIIDKQIQNGADAIVTELIKSGGTADNIKDISGKAVLALTGTGVETDVDIEGKFATIAPDNYQIGRALGNEVLLRHQTGLSDLRIGIVAKRMDTYSSVDKVTGIFDTLEVQNGNVNWCIILGGEDGDDFLKNRAGGMQIFRNDLQEASLSLIKKIYRDNPVDIIVALDDDSLQAAAELFGEIENAYESNSTAYTYKLGENGKLLPSYELYGEGTSIRNISYLDRGRIISMIVPNEFSMGYIAVEKAVSKLDHKLTSMKDDIVEYRVINQENMFKDDIQKYLFTTMQ